MTLAILAGKVKSLLKCVMMRGNSTARKLVLMLALVSMIGVGIGCMCEDPFLAGASYADDPATPAPSGSLAMVAPAEPQFMPVPSKDSSGAAETAALEHAFGSSHRPSVPHLPLNAIELPRRC